MKKCVVVGAGFSGTVVARSLADSGVPVHVVEKRPHVAGNMYDEYEEHGILVQRYGPHIVCTNQYRVMEYLEQYSEFFQYTAKGKTQIDGNYVHMPYDYLTVQQLIGPRAAEPLIAKMRQVYAGRDRVPILELVQSSEPDIAAYGELLFDKAYRPYLAKQWDIPLHTIGPEIMDRVPMAMGYDERYMNKDFQYLPKEGFTQLFKVMLDHPNITLGCGVDALGHITLDKQSGQVSYDGEQLDCLVFTGSIDELFGFVHGALPYRSLDFTYEYFDAPSTLPETHTLYPQAPGYTRKTEYQKRMYDATKIRGSLVATEYPMAYTRDAEKGTTPYYPVDTQANQNRYQQYLAMTSEYPALSLCGRLAEYRYYNMDECILNALKTFGAIKERLGL
jgi:UDP-galactopyranose mutase